MTTPLYGTELVAFYNPEATFDTPVAPAAGDALRVTSATFGRPYGTATPTDRRGTRSVMERTAARDPVQPWAMAGILRPSGTLGTAPEINELLTAAFGTETIVASTSVAYTLLKNMTTLSGTIHIQNDELQQGVSGAVITSLSFTWSGEEYITWSAEGEAATYIEAGYTLANGAGAASSTLIVDDADYFTAGGIIQVGTDDNSGAGHLISSINYATETLTLASTATWSDNDVVKPFLPSGTYVGDPLFGVDGSVSFDNGSSTVKTLGGSFTYETGITLFNSSYGSTKPEEVVNPSRRNVQATFDFLARRNNTYLGNLFRRKVSQDVQIILGDTAAKRIKINLNTMELDPEQYDSPDEDMLRWSATGIALGSSGEDEVDLFLD